LDINSDKSEVALIGNMTGVRDANKIEGGKMPGAFLFQKSKRLQLLTP
jgi:hypothetical protein